MSQAKMTRTAESKAKKNLRRSEISDIRAAFRRLDDRQFTSRAPAGFYSVDEYAANWKLGTTAVRRRLHAGHASGKVEMVKVKTDRGYTAYWKVL